MCTNARVRNIFKIIALHIKNVKGQAREREGREKEMIKASPTAQGNLLEKVPLRILPKLFGGQCPGNCVPWHCLFKTVWSISQGAFCQSTGC
jgi:hypothetical protein